MGGRFPLARSAHRTYSCLVMDEDIRFDVYRNPEEQLILDPQVSIPASEAWLYRKPKALASVRQGLQDAAEGKVVSIGSFAEYVDEE